MLSGHPGHEPLSAKTLHLMDVCDNSLHEVADTEILAQTIV
mgnify:CR=1 FL=1